MKHVMRVIFGVLALAALLAGTARNDGDAAPAKPSNWTAVCPEQAHVLDGVWELSRLRVIGRCRRAIGTVADIDHEPDGDLHVYVALDRHFRYLLARRNFTAIHGSLLAEFMPRDAGHLPAPRMHDRVILVGAWVYDRRQAWHEFHPVWYVRINGRAGHVSGPQFGGSPANSSEDSAAATCRTAAGAVCRGY